MIKHACLLALQLQIIERLADQEEGSEDQIVVPMAVMKQFFDTLLDRIITAVQGSLDRASRGGEQCDYMLLVGGFGSSPYLIARLRKAFSHQVLKQVVCPGVPSQAVLKGTHLYKLALRLLLLSQLCIGDMLMFHI